MTFFTLALPKAVGPPLWAKPRYLPKGSESSNHNHLKVLGEPSPHPLGDRNHHSGGLGVAGLNWVELNSTDILFLCTPVDCETSRVQTAAATTTS